jgi:hypothetical protein
VGCVLKRLFQTANPRLSFVLPSKAANSQTPAKMTDLVPKEKTKAEQVVQ